MGKIITICGGSGSGKTTVAANLGYILSQKYVVGIISTNKMFGGIQHLFGTVIDGQHGIYELMMSPGADITKMFMPCSNNKNLFLMALSNGQDCLKLADEESNLNGEAAKNLILEMKEIFNILIVDCDPDINNPLSVYSMMFADKILNLIKPTVPGTAFYNSYKAIYTALQIPNDKFLHIANGDKNYVGIRNIEKTANVKVNMTIPFCREVEEAENKGIPICKTGGRINEFVGCMKSIADDIKDGGYFG